MDVVAPLPVTTVLCDLDGVVWLAHQPIAGSVEAIEVLRAGRSRVMFVTNNSAATEAMHEAALASIGIDATGDVASSAGAAATMVAPGDRVLVAGGPGVVEAFTRRGCDVVVNAPDGLAGSFDAVVVGMHRDFDYGRLAAASAAVRAGARLIGTNSDTTYPTPEGLLPGGGALLAAVAAASGVEPELAGKPHRPMADLVIEMAGGASFDPRRVVMVGDRIDTDGRFAHTLGCRFALVRSGVTPPGVLAPGRPGDLDVPDLAAVAAALAAQRPGEE